MSPFRRKSNTFGLLKGSISIPSCRRQPAGGYYQARIFYFLLSLVGCFKSSQGIRYGLGRNAGICGSFARARAFNQKGLCRAANRITQPQQLSYNLKLRWRHQNTLAAILPRRTGSASISAFVACSVFNPNRTLMCLRSILLLFRRTAKVRRPDIALAPSTPACK